MQYLLTADDKDDYGIPLVKPVSCGRDGQAPILIKLPSLHEEAYAIADQLSHAHKEGCAWGDMAIYYNPAADAIQIMTMKVSKGLEFSLGGVARCGARPPRAKTSRMPRGCLMWRRRGLRTNW